METVNLFFGDSSFQNDLDTNQYDTVQLAINDNFIDQKIKSIAEKAKAKISDYINAKTNQLASGITKNIEGGEGI